MKKANAKTARKVARNSQQPRRTRAATSSPAPQAPAAELPAAVSSAAVSGGLDAMYADAHVALDALKRADEVPVESVRLDAPFGLVDRLLAVCEDIENCVMDGIDAGISGEHIKELVVAGSGVRVAAVRILREGKANG